MLVFSTHLRQNKCRFRKTFSDTKLLLAPALGVHSTHKCNSLDKKAASDQKSHWPYDPMVVSYKVAMTYYQLNREQRYTIAQLHKQGRFYG